MTEKRFTLKQGFNDELDYGVFLLDNGKKLTTDEVVELLNMLLEENEQLREEIKDFQELLTNREDELLKPIISQIEEAYETERTNIGKSVLKQLLENIE